MISIFHIGPKDEIVATLTALSGESPQVTVEAGDPKSQESILFRGSVDGWMDQRDFASAAGPTRALPLHCHAAGFSVSLELTLSPLYIRVAGKVTRNPVQKTAKSLFAPKSSRVLRVLLTDPARSWSIQNLCAEAGVSIGLTSKLKRRLVDLELVEDVKSGVRLTNPGESVQLPEK